MRTLVIALTLLLLAPFAPAQDGPPGAQRRWIEHMDFDGGTLAEYVDTLRALFDPTPVNVLLRNEAADLTVSPVELRRVSLDTALEIAVRPGPYRFRRPDGTLVERWVHTNQVHSDTGGATVYVIDATSQIVDEQKNDEPPSRTFEVFGLGRVITDGNADGVLEILDAAMSLDDADPAELRFHKDSGLLIVRGTHDQIVLIDEVVGRLEADRSRATGEDRQRAEHIADLEFELQRTAARMELSRRQLDVAERGYMRMRELADTGSAPESEVDAAELLLIDRRTNLQQAEAEIFHIQQMLELARAEAADSSAVLAQILRPVEGQDQLGERVRMLEQEIEELRAQNQQLRTELEESQR